MNIKLIFIGCVVGASLSGCEFGKGVADITRNVGGAWANTQTQIVSDFITDVTSKRVQLTKRDKMLENLEFTCVKEQFPALPSEADILYKYALYHDFKNRWLPKPKVLDKYLPYYRIAAANGHWQANLTLQEILLTFDDIDMPIHERRAEGIELNEKLMKTLPATAHYWWVKYITKGYGAKHKPEDAAIYLRKAADLGHGKAQYKVAEYLMSIKDEHSHAKRLDIRTKLYICAGEQIYPNKDGALMAQVHFENEKNYIESTKFAYLSAKAGSSISMLSLSNRYNPPENSRFLIWGIKVDTERAKRYRQIAHYLSSHAYLEPELNVMDLDEIAPLPPAPLPEWDGKIAIQRFVEGAPPAKPSDELVRRLAEQAGLDAATGLPK